MKGKCSRRLGREQALQLLFAAEFQGAPPTMDETECELSHHEMADNAFTKVLIEGVSQYKAKIDSIITNYLTKNWTVPRLDKVDATILRIAVFEMTFAKEVTEPAIVINESVELAKMYGSDRSYKLINGILDVYAKTRKPVNS